MALRFTTRKLFIATTIVAFGALWSALRPTPIEKLFGGRRNVDVVAHPAKVVAYRFGPPPKDINLQEEPPSHYAIISGPVELPAEAAKKVSAALLSPATYLWDWAKACRPVYDVQLSFIRGDDRVDVLLYFGCDMLSVGRDGEAFGEEDFDNARGVFVRAAKECFPDDEVIQQLQSK